MSKLSKFLELHGSILKENESGSSYYLIAHRQIRVSNHLSSIIIPDQLMILLPEKSKKQYIVVFLGKLIIHDSYTSLRVFLEHWIMISQSYAFKQLVLQTDKIQRLEAQLTEALRIKSVKSKVVYGGKKLAKKSAVIEIPLVLPVIMIADKPCDLSVFTKNQRKSILNWEIENKPEKEQADAIKVFLAQNLMNQK